MDSSLKKTIVAFLTKEGAKTIALFGSYARGTATKKSDIDILVSFSQPKSLMEMVRLERTLSKKIGIKTDIITKKAISPLIYKKIQKQLEVIHS